VLYRMPTSAADENWLCVVLNDILEKGFNDVDAGIAPTAWPNCLPEVHLETLRRRGKLGEAITAVIAAYNTLAPDARALVREAREDQMHLADMFEGGRTASTLTDLPEVIRAPLDNYSKRVFDVLDDLGIRARSYKFHDEEGRLACAFCGYEAADNSLVRQMDWDHYLVRSRYPFAGVNLWNFTPMGDACNGKFKAAKDILRNDLGARRRCFDPYVSEPAAMDLLASTLFARGPGNQLPQWVITFTGDAEYCETWDNVFSLRERWTARLDIVHRGCLNLFGAAYRGIALTDDQIVERLNNLSQEDAFGNLAAGGFLATALFALWADKAAVDGGDADRLRRLLRRMTQPIAVAI
jgi:hypothetical protein